MGVRASVEWTCWAVTMTSPSSATPCAVGAASGSAAATVGRAPVAISHRPRYSGHDRMKPLMIFPPRAFRARPDIGCWGLGTRQIGPIDLRYCDIDSAPLRAEVKQPRLTR